MTRDEILARLKESMVSDLYMEGLSAGDIGDDAPLFGADGLGLDSLDAVELVVLLERRFGIAVESPEEVKRAFASPAALADFILARSATGRTA